MPNKTTFFSQGQKRVFSKGETFNPFEDIAASFKGLPKGKAFKAEFNVFVSAFGIEVDTEQLQAIFPFMASGKASKIDVKKLLTALKTLLKTLSSESTMQDIAKEAYKNVVPQLFEQYLAKKEALTIEPTGTVSFEEAAARNKARNKGRIFNAKEGLYRAGWKKIVDMITDGSSGRLLKWHPNKFGGSSFSLADLQSVTVSRSRSKFNSIFMMEEFGTGQLAEPNQRIYAGKGSTFFKVPPYIIRAIEPKIGKGELAASTALWFITAGAVAAAEKQYSIIMQFRGKRDAKSRAKYGRAQRALNSIIYGSDNRGGLVFGFAEGRHRAREARHLFYDKEGLVKSVRDIQKKFEQEVLRVLDERLKKQFPTGVPIKVTQKK